MKSYTWVQKQNSNSAPGSTGVQSRVSSDPDTPSLATSPLAWILGVPSCLESWALVSPQARLSSTPPAIIPCVKPPRAAWGSCEADTHTPLELRRAVGLQTAVNTSAVHEVMREAGVPGGRKAKPEAKREERRSPGGQEGNEKHGTCHESQRSFRSAG